MKVLLWIFLGFAIASMLAFYTATPPKMTKALEPATGQATSTVVYALAQAEGSHDTNECWFMDTTLFDEVVTVVYPEREGGSDIVGTWAANTNTISLMQPGGLDIQTVSHEVSHMVSTFMDKYQPEDDHFRAYMQGYWTWCVWTILQEDLGESQRFRFAN